jgi:hypothetical protein
MDMSTLGVGAILPPSNCLVNEVVLHIHKRMRQQLPTIFDVHDNISDVVKKGLTAVESGDGTFMILFEKTKQCRYYPNG